MALGSRSQCFDGRVIEKSGGSTSQNQVSREVLDKVHALVDSNGRAVVLLRVFKSSSCPSSVPVFYEDENIVGSVELNLLKPELVQEVILSIKGTMKGLTGHSREFIEVTEQLWSPSGVEQTTSRDAQIGQILKGSFSWPFCLKLPSHIAQCDGVLHSATDNQFLGRLPPSFSVPSYHSSIIYKLCVTIRGTRNLTLSYPFNYVPTTRPPSLASPLGYSCNQVVNEDRWEVFQAFSIRGIAFTAFSTDISCTFALPKPLCYTRGTPFLCALKLESPDENILELLGNPRALRVQLSRRVEDTNSGLETKIARFWDAIKQPSTFVSSASWSVAEAGDDQSSETRAALRLLGESTRGSAHSKILIGRIPLASDITPSFSFGKMSLKYEIQMLAFKAAGFVPEDGEKAVFFRTEIGVASSAPRPGSAASSFLSLSRSNSSSGHERPNTASQSQNTNTLMQTSTNPPPILSHTLEATTPPPPPPPPPPSPPQNEAESWPSPRSEPVRCSYDRDRPLPSLPPNADSGSSEPDHQDHTRSRTCNSNNNRQLRLLCGITPNDEQPDVPSVIDLNEQRKDSRSECSPYSILRRAATAPRISTTTSSSSLDRRTPFPSRQYTR